MASFLVADPLFPTYELEAHNRRIASYSEQSAAKIPRLRSPQSLQNINSSGGPSIRDTGNRANRRSRRTSHSASLTDLDALVGDYEKLNFLKRCGTDGKTGSELPLPVKVDTLETSTVAEKISALARNHITDWQERKAEKRTNKRQQAWPSEQPYILPTNRRNNSRGCSCGPPGCCIFEKLAKEDREAEATEEAAITAAEEIVKNRRNSRQIIPIFGKTHYLICTKSSKGKDKDKGKGKEVDTTKDGGSDIGKCSFREDPSDDEDETSLSISSRIPWYPEFQTKPPPSCNCLLFKLGHGFSDGEIQKMRWFLDRIGRGLAVPGDWFEEETLYAAQRECRQWNILHPLRPQSLEPPPMSFLDKNWIIVHCAPISTKQPPLSLQGHSAKSFMQPTSHYTMKLRHLSSRLAEHTVPSSVNLASTKNYSILQSDPPRANRAPVTLEEYITASKSASQPRFKRPSLKVNTSVHGDDQPGITPGNTPEIAVIHGNLPVREDMSVNSALSNVAGLSLGVRKAEESRELEIKD